MASPPPTPRASSSPVPTSAAAPPVSTPPSNLHHPLPSQLVRFCVLGMPHLWRFTRQFTDYLCSEPCGYCEKYRFKTSYDCNTARTIWNKICVDRFSDALARAREKAKQVTVSENVADYKGHGPRGMRTEIWDGLVGIWNTPGWKNKSIKAKMNRVA
ncbi:hypothetical protein JHK82_030937 [Glycine max]|uniref:Uncharacterized protein n=1 Tax=Glycine max TaxID=3847 RepID=A0A0R0HGW6_SOYBN|nr:hypothetical protein JHK85_031584 [Glycine max]KAG4994207.1 hypothetical protein JHK86_031034 [Glycine max]KAG5124200.1 hypothetical protein JHK82_030937 [Glycine max]KAH1159097.1 hypothetical protein GYH30_031013 [Glycine max]KRH29809.1 hypothetical protein GLYMA_11G140300v4 [Glycine max]